MWPPMDTKTQSQPITQPQPRSKPRSPNHTCHHCQGCSRDSRRSQSRSQSPSQSPPSHRSLGHQSQSPNPSLPPRHPKQTGYSHHTAMRSTAPCSSYSKNRKTLGGKVNKKKVKRNRKAYKTKRRSSGLHTGRKYH